jgi:hypothetical protein
MPDMKSSGGKKAGYLHSYSNQEIARCMAEERQRIAGNEWDWFGLSRHFDIPAITATSCRKPLDRHLSQFRSECIKDRGCKSWDVDTFHKGREDMYSVYTQTQTFADTPATFGKPKAAYEGMAPTAAQQ